MPNRLFLRPVNDGALGDGLSHAFDWALYDVTGRKVKSGGAGDLDIIEQTLMQNGIDNLEVLGLWPANLAYCSYVKLPGNQTRYINQALPFAIEEQLAQDVDSVHLALGEKAKDGAFPVVAVDKAGFSALYTVLSEQHEERPLNAFYLDAAMLSLQDCDLAICFADSRVLLNSRKHLALSIEKDNLIPYLDALFLGTDEERDADQSFRMQLYIEEAMADELSILQAELQQYPGVEITTTVLEISWFELLCESYFHRSRLPINLCQGEFKLSTASSGLWQRWRYVAMIAGLGLLVQLGVFVGKGVYYQQQADRIGEQAVQEYKKYVPAGRVSSIDKLPRIIKGKLNQLKQQGGAEADFLTLLGEAGYQHYRSSDKNEMVFNSINFNAQRNELVIELKAGSFDQLERLKQAIVGAGMTAKISSAVQEDKHYRGRISVSGAGS